MVQDGDIGCRGSMPPREVLPVNGTREALFAFAQAVIDGSRPAPIVVCPNPFYQIYEGAALLAGAEPRVPQPDGRATASTWISSR